MKVDIFLRTYSGDIEWAIYALRSIHRFVTGIRDIIVCVPANDYNQFKRLNFTREILCSSRFPDREGYMDQMLDKMSAYHYTEADTILFWDSDVLATRQFSPADLMIDAKPRWLVTPYAKLVNPDGSSAVPWRPITEKALGRSVDLEGMRAHPLMAPRRALLEFRGFMEGKHRMSLQDYIEAQPSRAFSEWNALGMWAYYYAPHHFSFWNTETKGVPEPFVKQFWSWGGITPEIRAEMERILGWR